MFRLFAVDLDGTLLHAKGHPHPQDIAALRALKAHGVAVTIITGRLYSGTRESAVAADIRGPVACADGSIVVHAETHETLLHRTISRTSAKTARDILAQLAPVTFVFSGDKIVYDAMGEPFLEYISLWSRDLHFAKAIHEHSAWEAAEGITAFVAIGMHRQIESAATRLREETDDLDVTLFSLRKMPGAWALIAKASGGSKGAALEWLANHYQCALSETVCVGDWLNDISMLKTAGRSFAMGHAPREVKEVSTDVLEETAENGGGIARAIEVVFGIRTLNSP